MHTVASMLQMSGSIISSGLNKEGRRSAKGLEGKASSQATSQIQVSSSAGKALQVMYLYSLASVAAETAPKAAFVRKNTPSLPAVMLLI